MSTTSIEWTDKVWNPVTGCSKVSAGCKHCYAETVAKRFFAKQYPPNADGSLRVFTDVRCHEERLEEPLHWRKPSRIFVNSMSDLFHEDVPFEFIDHVFAVMALCPQHTFQVLTKRPERMLQYLKEIQDDNKGTRRWESMACELTGSPCAAGVVADVDWPLCNVWLGVSVEDQKTADERIPLLLDTPAVVRFVSYEPALGPVNFDLCAPYVLNGDDSNPGYLNAFNAKCHHPLTCRVKPQVEASPDGISWVICGGESGPGARPMHPDWARSVRDQCAAAGVPFFFKQWGEWIPTDIEKDESFAGGFAFDHPSGGRQALVIREKSTKAFTSGQYRSIEPGDHTKGGVYCLDEKTVTCRVGKKITGRLLDGVEHNAFPQAKQAAIA